tara:strand:- start:342 stop:851 length:510 start_codon:yes stop_codon:yes gene_type:complete
MPNLESDAEDFIEEEESFLEIVKPLPLTRNEALYLSDSITLLMEHTPEQGRVHMPARQLMPQAAVPVPLDLIQKVGLAVLLTTNTMEEDEESIYEIDLTVADLFLLRECCQSFIKVNNELVGFNLLRKIYALVLEEDMKERKFFQDMTRGINLDTIIPENIEERKDFNG